MEKKIVQIRVGKSMVGIPRLVQILEEVKAMSLDDDQAIGAELLTRVKETSYVPRSVEGTYREALIKEYHRSVGESVEDEPGLKVIRILGPGCPRCEELMRRVLSVLQEEGIEADVQHLRDVTEIASYGVLGTPGLVVNGKVVFSGRVPSAKDLKKLIASA